MIARQVIAVLLLVGMWAYPSSSPAQAVQLPTYSYFNTRSTVSVPDRGSAYLGGVNRARSGRNEFGMPLLPFGNRSIGMDRSASSARVSVYIHDLQAMDEYLLSRPTRTFPLGYRPPGSLAINPRQPRTDSSTVAPAAVNVAELRAKHQRDQATRRAEAEQFFHRGQNAEAAGKLSVAKIYYRQAARRADGELKQQILARLDPAGSFAVARRNP